VYLSSAEVYDPSDESWTTTTAPMSATRAGHTATLLPSGRVMVAGGAGPGGFRSSAEVYDAAVDGWSSAGSSVGRSHHTMTLLPSGKVLVAGGYNGAVLSGAEVYDGPASWSAAASMATTRYAHTATLLPSGKVLVAGGGQAGNGSVYLSSAELYDPAANSWTPAASMAAVRQQHKATLLQSGKVLITGGTTTGGGAVASAEVYDPATDTWSPAGSMAVARNYHTATLLPSGKVLVAGGVNNVYLFSAELYDPTASTWSPASSMATARLLHTATLLPSGKVLVAGGDTTGMIHLSSAEVYDPATDSWSATGSMAQTRGHHTATLLASGEVLAAAGVGNSGYLSSAEAYDLVSGTWSSAASMSGPRVQHNATLLPNGRVLVVGGENNLGDYPSSAELYDEGRGFDEAWRPVVDSATSPLALGSALDAAGTGFTGLSEAGGGNGAQNSSSNYPVVFIRAIGNEQTRTFNLDESVGWSATSFKGLPLTDFPQGWALVTVVTNGIPSVSSSVLVTEGAAPNAPPDAVCKNITVSAGPTCTAVVNAEDVSDGSSDPEDGTNITLGISPAGPYALGETLVTLTATDSLGATDTCQATITVVDDTPPVIDFTPADVTRVGVCPLTNPDPTDTGLATAIDNCDSNVTVTYDDADSGSCPTRTITRTWTATDNYGKTSTSVQTIRYLPASNVEVTNGSCAFDMDPSTPDVQDFRLLFTQDPKNFPKYKVTASNPGQTFYNVFHNGTPGEAVSFEITLPYPFVTKGAQPIQAYDGVEVSGDPACYTPGARFFTGSNQVTLSSYAPQAMGSTTTFTVTLTVPASGFVFLRAHLDYGLKGTSGYTSDLSGNASGPVAIPNHATYTFASEVNGATSTDSISNINIFKKLPGVGGFASSKYPMEGGTSGSIPVTGAAAVLKDAKGTVLATGTTDEDGWYMCSYKWTKKATTLTVELTAPGKPALKQAFSLKSNGYAQVDFIVP
jgi:N-acetylneuraminic acid mutarotase